MTPDVGDPPRWEAFGAEHLSCDKEVEDSVPEELQALVVVRHLEKKKRVRNIWKKKLKKYIINFLPETNLKIKSIFDYAISSSSHSLVVVRQLIWRNASTGVEAGMCDCLHQKAPFPEGVANDSLSFLQMVLNYMLLLKKNFFLLLKKKKNLRKQTRSWDGWRPAPENSSSWRCSQ